MWLNVECVEMRSDDVEMAKGKGRMFNLVNPKLS